MKQWQKVVLLVVLLCACAFLLSGCYMEPDNITGTPVSTGGSNLSWASAVTPTSIPTPTVSSASVVPLLTPEAIMTPPPVSQTTPGSSGVILTPTQNPNGMITLTTPTAYISIVTPYVATSPAPVTSATPGVSTATATPSVYKLGTSGNVVRSIQSRLKQLGYLTGTVDGDFGEATQAAVKAFQANNGLNPDGVVGKQTFDKLNSTSARTAKPTATPTPNPATTVYKNGTTGTVVKSIQSRLISLGYLAAGNNTGFYGDLTEAAVKAFQTRNGLTADGVVGQGTLKKLNSTSAIAAANGGKTTAKPTAKPTAKATAKPTATPNVEKTYLELGNSSAKVSTMQRSLISMGYLVGSADGNFGYATQAAVKAFQSRNNLWSDGVAGPKTLNLLYSGNGRTASTPAAVIGQTLRLNDTGAGVRALQSRLITLGYLKGTADGKFGEATQTALKAFQANNGLTADGAAGTATFNKLHDPAVRGAGSAINTPTPTATATPNPSSTGYTTLRQNDEGSAVSKLQNALKKQNYYTGSVDGKYGSGTVAAVKAFQTVNQITVDGVAGPTTQRLLYGNTGVDPSKYTALRLYDEGTGVYNLQYSLYELGYYKGAMNGIYTTATQTAVMDFQRNNGLTSDGAAGPKTLALLYSSYAKSSKNRGSTTFEKLQMGDKGNSVIELQVALCTAGYVVPTDGIFGTETQAAIVSFQNKNGLSVDGIAGDETQSLLYSGKGK